MLKNYLRTGDRTTKVVVVVIVVVRVIAVCMAAVEPMGGGRVKFLEQSAAG